MFTCQNGTTFIYFSKTTQDMQNAQLKKYLRESLRTEIVGAKQKIEACNQSLDVLAKTSLNNAKYLVGIYSHWAPEGEKDISITYKGALESAIKTAETEFKEVNKRSDVQGKYTVRIFLGEALHLLPEQFFEQYKQKIIT